MNTEIQHRQKQFGLTVRSLDEPAQAPLLYALATMDVSKTLFDDTLYKMKVNIRCELIRTINFDNGVFIHEKERKPIEFQITATSSSDRKMRLSTGLFFIDIQDAKK